MNNCCDIEDASCVVRSESRFIREPLATRIFTPRGGRAQFCRRSSSRRLLFPFLYHDDDTSNNVGELFQKALNEEEPAKIYLANPRNRRNRRPEIPLQAIAGRIFNINR